MSIGATCLPLHRALGLLLLLLLLSLIVHIHVPPQNLQGDVGAGPPESLVHARVAVLLSSPDLCAPDVKYGSDKGPVPPQGGFAQRGRQGFGFGTVVGLPSVLGEECFQEGFFLALGEESYFV